MRLLIGSFLASLAVFTFITIKPAAAQQIENIWAGTVTITEIGKPSAQAMASRPDCEFKPVKVVKMNPPVSTVFGNIPILKDLIYQDQGINCVITNSQGSFAAPVFSGNVSTQRIQYYSGSSNASRMYSLLNSNASVFLDPAPSGDNVLMISGILGANYSLTLIRDFKNESWLSRGGPNNIEWRAETAELRLKAQNGANFAFSKHAFSSNGRFLAIMYNGILGKIDLQTMELTPVEVRASWPNATEIAISNNGRNVAVLGNGLYIFDTKDCETKFTYGEWEGTKRNSYPGCVKGRNFQTGFINQTGYDLGKRPYFSQNSAALLISAAKSVVDSDNPALSYIEWKEFNIKADLHQSQANGYIAMGDSFSSGEGDLEGGTWYEPGTDEQGNKDTFEGRNLCHLSRRSYPYLIAKELGYLPGNASEPVTPSDSSPFHSVACSGAVIHNISGTRNGILNSNVEKANDDYDNQYRNDYLGQLGAWQPGRIKQLDFFTGENSFIYRDPKTPEIITIGVGGNDAGFGDIINSCIMPDTCKYAVSGSPSAGLLAAKIANLKAKLIDTYTTVKQTNPDSRVYIHGYPKFAQTDGDCAVNVRLDAQEVIMANEGVMYMNAIIQAAALEAGVFYVDVTDILINRNLCSLAPADQKAFNGVTAGNDISNLYLNIGTRGICFVRSGCFGKETFHPNHLGHQLYKQAIITQSSNLTALMPTPTQQPYPVPSDFFGSQVQSEIISANISGGLMSDTILIPIQQPLISQGTTGDLNLNQTSLLSGSKAELSVQSEPIIIGIYDVPQNGVLDADFNIPVNLPAGVHEIHLKGTDKFGEKFDYYEQVMIGFSDTDFDGDGVLNVVDKCPTVINSNVDVDQDGIDDVCDNEAIPAVVEPPPPTDPPAEPPKQTTLVQKIVNLLKKIVIAIIALFR